MHLRFLNAKTVTEAKRKITMMNEMSIIDGNIAETSDFTVAVDTI